MFRDCMEVPYQGFGSGIMAGRKKCAVCRLPISNVQLNIHTSMKGTNAIWSTNSSSDILFLGLEDPFARRSTLMTSLPSPLAILCLISSLENSRIWSSPERNPRYSRVGKYRTYSSSGNGMYLQVSLKMRSYQEGYSVASTL